MRICITPRYARGEFRGDQRISAPYDPLHPYQVDIRYLVLGSRLNCSEFSACQVRRLDTICLTPILQVWASTMERWSRAWFMAAAASHHAKIYSADQLRSVNLGRFNRSCSLRQSTRVRPENDCASDNSRNRPNQDCGIEPYHSENCGQDQHSPGSNASF